MPSYSWRTQALPTPDLRLSAAGQPLRRSMELSFLSPDGPESLETGIHHFLYQTQVSILVTGWNIDSWKAICLADTFFDNPLDDIEDCTEFYTNDACDGDVSLDPLAAGRLLVDKTSIKDPRYYFLLVVRYRVQRIVDEWRAVCSHMEHVLEKAVSHMDHCFLHILIQHSSRIKTTLCFFQDNIQTRTLKYRTTSGTATPTAYLHS